MNVILPVLLLFALSLSTAGEAFRVGVFIPNAPMYGIPQMQAFQKRLVSEIDSIAKGKVDLQVQGISTTDCSVLSCAQEVGKAQKLDLVVVSSLQQKGGAHDFDISVISVQRGVTVSKAHERFGANLGQFEPRRPAIITSLVNELKVALTSVPAEVNSASLRDGTPITSTVLSGFLPAKDSPYLVYGNVSVPAGEELLIEPGVEILFVPGQSGGFSVFGQLTAEGTTEKPIRFLSASKNPQVWDWNRILISGDGRSTLSNVEVSHSNYGVHVENSSLTLQNAKIHGNSLRGLYVRNGSADVQDVTFSDGQDVALQAAGLSRVNVIRSKFIDNRNAIVIMSQGSVDLSYSRLEKNDRAIVLIDGASLATEKNTIERNQIGVVSEFPLAKDAFDGVRENQTDMTQASRSTLESAVEEPSTTEVDRTVLKESTKGEIGERREPEQWNTYGNVQVGGGYTKVVTSRNQGPLLSEVDSDTFAVGQKYPNRFTVDGAWAVGNAYVVMESNKGRGLEIQAETKADKWVYSRSKPVTVRYWSPLHSITLGHLNESGSPLLLSGFEVLGAKYQLNLGQNAEQQPLVSTEAFFGESRQSYAEGDRNPDLYGDHYPEDGAISQQLTAYGRIGLELIPRWKIQVGAIVADDRKEDPLLRDGIGATQELRDPLTESKAAFVSTEWGGRNGSFRFRADVAVGRADTADVFYQNALDAVFAEAGLPNAALSDVRTLFLSDANIREGDSSAIVALVGPELSLSEARDSLIVLRQMVLEKQSELEKEGKDGRTANMSWEKQNIAGRLQMEWNYQSGNVQVSMQSIGSNYFSPGASGLLQNSREYGIDWNQTLKSYWDISTRYLLSVENAAGAGDGASNILGFGEGSSSGLWADDSWKKEHLMDADRTRYVHQAALDQNFRVGKNLSLSVGYQVEHSRQYLPTKLKADVSSDAAVFLDPWFVERTGRSTLNVDRGYGDSIAVDSARWTSFATLGASDSIAWGFHDVRTKHGITTEATWTRKNYSIKVGGQWTMQLDQSEFTKDQQVRDFDLKDSSWQKLGYNPNAQTWFEQSYPITLSHSIATATNKATFKPRWRTYEKNEQEDFEYSFIDRLEIPFLKRKLLWSVEGGVFRRISEVLSDSYWIESKDDSTRYAYYRVNDDGIIVPVSSPQSTDIAVQGGEGVSTDYRVIREKMEDRTRQWDLSLSSSFRVNWTTRLFTELTGRVDDYRRPDQLEEQHRDFTGSMNVFYSF